MRKGLSVQDQSFVDPEREGDFLGLHVPPPFPHRETHLSPELCLAGTSQGRAEAIRVNEVLAGASSLAQGQEEEGT